MQRQTWHSTAKCTVACQLDDLVKKIDQLKGTVMKKKPETGAQVWTVLTEHRAACSLLSFKDVDTCSAENQIDEYM